MKGSTTIEDPSFSVAAVVGPHDGSELEKFWRQSLSPFGRQRAAKGGDADSNTRGLEEALLSEDVSAALLELERQHHLTLDALLFGAWALVLHAYSGEEEVSFGVLIDPFEGGPTPAGIAGPLLLRVELDLNQRLLPWVGQLQRRLKALQASPGIPCLKVAQEIDAPSAAVFESVVVGNGADRGRARAACECVQGPWSSSLVVRLELTGDQLKVELRHDRNHFTSALIHRLIDQLKAVCTAIALNPGQRVGEVPCWSDRERRQVLHEWNRTSAETGSESRVHELFEQQVERTPNALAVSDGHSQLTYAQLNERAEDLARRLRSSGIGPEKRVALRLDRSIDLIVAMVGVMKSGGAYLPLDPTHPADRLAFMLEDASAPILLVPESDECNCAIRFPSCQVMALGRAREQRDGEGEGHKPGIAQLDLDPRPPPPSRSRQLAYVIYTSGSTGTPKGVEVEHASLTNLVQWHCETYGVSASDRASLVASPAFDASTWEIWPYLTAGASLHIPDETVRRSPAQLVSWLSEEKITLSFVPTPLVEAMLEEPWPKTVSLRALLTGGDKLHRGLPEDFPCLLVNHYGPTETTVVATWGVVPIGAEAPPIGRPIRNTRVYVLDGRLQPVPIGVPGELYIGGAGTARGYLNRPDLTPDRFVADPFSADPEARLYRTGDLVRWRAEGALDYLGRMDDQVKIRGNRIDLGEIEATLRTLPGIRDAAVVAWMNEPEPATLAAYVIPRTPADLDLVQVRQFLQKKLPEYMLPASLVALDAMPLTSRGKIDRRALPRPVCDPAVRFVAPKTTTERVVADIWSELLHQSQIGSADNFFHLGGHSLLAAQVLARVQRQFQVELRFADLLESPTLGELAARIDQAQSGATGGPPLVRLPPADWRRLSFAQERLWWLEQLEPGVPFNNIPIAARLRGAIDSDAMEKALDAIVARHEPLRSAFVLRQDQPWVRVLSPQRFHVRTLDLTGLPDAERPAEARRILDEEAKRPFDLDQPPLLRATFVRIAANDHWFVLVTHHIACDGWSLGVFYRELSALYAAFAHGQPERPAKLPDPVIGYGDFAAWQRSWVEASSCLADSLTYWKTQLADASVLKLPTDRPRPRIQTYRGAVHLFHLDDTLNRKLIGLSQREGVTLFMLLLAAWQTLLHRYSGQEDILVAAPIAGRGRVETEGLIGVFLNLLVLRCDLSGDPSFSSLLKRVRRVACEAYQHQHIPFERLVDALQPERDLSHSPLAQVLFIWHNQSMAPPELPGIELETVPLHNGTARFDLTLSLEPAGPGIQGMLEYNTDLFDEATMVRLAGHFTMLLAGIVDHPDERVSALPILTANERHQLLTLWNDTDACLPEVCVHQWIEEQVLRTPQAPALVYGTETVTYQQLDEGATVLAGKLQALGVGPDTPVGVCLGRSPDMVVALLGILKAGGAYLPLDPGYPRERLDFMLQDAGVQVLITHPEIASAVTASKPMASQSGGRRPGPLKVLYLPLESNGAAAKSAIHLRRPAMTPDHLAYVIYTSGSTGQPKGVMVTHRNVINFFVGMDQVLATTPGVWLAVTSISFDISVLELLWTLARGFKVVIRPDERARKVCRIAALSETLNGRWQRSAERTDNGTALQPIGTPCRGATPQRRSLSNDGDSATRRTQEANGGAHHNRVKCGMDFSLFYFASDASGSAGGKYRLLIEGAKFADRHGFTAVWTPERHFHAFGGLYPNPSVTAAALAMVTERVRIRAGSVVLPLHDVVRVAEDWALVDNLSAGRVDISFASGWHPDDFILSAESYADRHAGLFRDIEEVRRLWRGESVRRRNGIGQEVALQILPRPIQAELPIWVTAAGSPDTFRRAGELGANLLTHLLGQSIEDLAAKIQTYRLARSTAGHTGEGKITLMLHTFVGADADEVRETVRGPFSEYLKTSLDLIAKNSSLGVDPKKLSPDDIDDLIERVFDRYFESSGLFGTPAACLQRVEQLKGIGVDEIACLIDFGVETDSVLESLTWLDEVRQRSSGARDLEPSMAQSTEGANQASSPASVQDECPAVESDTISDLILRHRVTHLQCTPSMAGIVLQEPRAEKALGQLQKLLLGGEPLPLKLAREIAPWFAGDLLNLYGPTETTIWSTVHPVKDFTAPIPIGRPLANTRIYLVDKAEQLVPIGVPGEVWIGGEGVTRGYLGQPELTEEKFTRDPFSTDGRSPRRVYRTGDLARYRADGQIEFLGRRDLQVKLRGHRIELGEIETLLGRHPGIREAVVTLQDDAMDGKRLVAYLRAKFGDTTGGDSSSVRSPKASFDEGSVRRFLKERLPDYMIPAIFVVMPAFPMTANGKVNRRALPPPELSGLPGVSDFVPPASETEKALALIWREVLGLKEVSVRDNFFDLGGHSLLIMQVISRVRDAFQIELRMRCLFDAPTIAGLARVIEEILLKEINQLSDHEAHRLVAVLPN